MFGGGAAVGHDPVHLVAGRSCWRRSPIGDLGDRHGVGGIDARPWAAEAWASLPL